MIRENLHGCFQFVKIAVISGCLVSVISAAKTEVPLFLFSGQSNMVGLGTSASTDDLKKTVDNIKIDCKADANTKKWTILGPGFGSNSSQFGPELFFGRTLADSMPNKKFAFIKDAVSGKYLGKTSDFLPPSSNNGTGGTLYKNMMDHIDDAMKRFKDAYDTTQYTPRWVGFVWLQGEFDAMDKALADKYEVNLTNLIKDIRAKTGVSDLPVIIPMICQSNTGMWKYIDIIHAADIAVTKKLTNCDTTSLKQYKYASDGVHFDAASMATIGTNCAYRWLAMKYPKDIPISVYRRTPITSSMQVSHSFTSRTQFDLSGRMVGTLAHSQGANQFHHQTSTLLIINRKDSRSGDQCYSKVLNLQQ